MREEQYHRQRSLLSRKLEILSMMIGFPNTIPPRPSVLKITSESGLPTWTLDSLWASKDLLSPLRFLFTCCRQEHGLFRVIRRRYFPRKIALCKSLTQVRDRRLGFKKLNKSKNSSNLDILIPSKFNGFVVSSI